MHILFPFPCGRWHISWNLVMIVLLSACQPASQKIILPSKLIPYTFTFFQGYWRSKPPLMYVDNWVAVIKVVICMNLEILNSAFQTLNFYIFYAFLCFARFPPILCQTYLSQRYNDTHTDQSVYKKPQTSILPQNMFWRRKSHHGL